jgi:hypothetical protein
MIKHTNLRNNGAGRHALGDSYEQKMPEALRSLVVYEMGYGGMVTDLSFTRVVIDTHIMSCHDRTIFEGAEDEMAWLVKVAGCHALLMGDETYHKALMEHGADVMEKVTGGSPLLCAFTAPFIIGEGATRGALLLAAGVHDETLVTKLAPLSLKELMALVELHIETGEPFEQVVAQTVN